MKTPAFWSNPASWQARLLSPLGWIYGQATLWRMKQRGFKLSIPVICVGNPTVGGMGKTPTAIALAKILLTMGKNPIFLSRGYGSNNKGVTLVQKHHTARDVGDEPLLLACIAPVIVSKNRVKGALKAVELGFDCVIMDDGFQNPSLYKDLTFLVMNDVKALEKQRIFPAGTLRAPLKDQISLASLCIIDAEIMAEKPHDLAYIAFCGIASPDKFKATLGKLGVNIAGFHAFPDHHYYTDDDAKMLLTAGLPLITTEKDGVKLIGALKSQSVILPITLKFQNEDEITRALRNIIVTPHLNAVIAENQNDLSAISLKLS
jgi:tetraacyldisaccharide 4'-kinase